MSDKASWTQKDSVKVYTWWFFSNENYGMCPPQLVWNNKFLCGQIDAVYYICENYGTRPTQTVSYEAGHQCFIDPLELWDMSEKACGTQKDSFQAYRWCFLYLWKLWEVSDKTCETQKVFHGAGQWSFPDPLTYWTCLTKPVGHIKFMIRKVNGVL